MLYYQLHSKVNKSVVLDCAIYRRHHDQKSKDSAWNENDDGNNNGNDIEDFRKYIVPKSGQEVMITMGKSRLKSCLTFVREPCSH